MVINNDRTIMGEAEAGGGITGDQGGRVISFIFGQRNGISSAQHGAVLNLTTFRIIDQQVENSERGHFYRLVLRHKVVNAMLSLVIFTMFISGRESVKRRRVARSLTNRF